MLEQENKKMEEKLKLVKQMMEMEKQKRGSAQGDRPTAKDGTMWRSATKTQSITGYSKAVMEHVKKGGPPRPPQMQQTQQTQQTAPSDERNPFTTGI